MPDADMGWGTILSPLLIIPLRYCPIFLIWNFLPFPAVLGFNGPAYWPDGSGALFDESPRCGGLVRSVRSGSGNAGAGLGARLIGWVGTGKPETVGTGKLGPLSKGWECCSGGLPAAV